MALMIPPQFNPKYKTSLCKHWTNTGNCSIGSRCHFAHGDKELRNPNDPLPQMPSTALNDPKILQVYFTGSLGLHNFKTTICNYNKEGKCKYAEYCHFAHSPDEVKSYVSIILNIFFKEEQKKLHLQMMVSQYHTLMQQHHFLNNIHGPQLNVTSEQVDIVLETELQKIVNKQQIKFILEEFTKMELTKEIKTKLATAQELFNAGNVVGASQMLSEIVNRERCPQAEAKAYEQILVRSTVVASEIVEKWQKEIHSFQIEQAIQMQEQYQKTENPQNLFGQGASMPHLQQYAAQQNPQQMGIQMTTQLLGIPSLQLPL